MDYRCTLLAVKDIEKSKEFYCSVLGLEVAADFGANVTLTGGIALQSLETWKGFISRKEDEILFANNASEIYFEEDDIEGFCEKLESSGKIEYIHRLHEHSWGQRVVRFYDPDMHVIEVGENISLVVRRFYESGLSEEDIASRMDVPLDFVKSSLKLKII